MSVPNDAVRYYFTPCHETFWKWSADEQAVEWLSGQTIAFRFELQSLAEHLAAEGLPPFENILLTVAACRNRSEAAIRKLPETLSFSHYTMRYSMVETLGKVVERLQSLSVLPEELRTSMEGKRAILTLIAENGSLRKKPDLSLDCVDWLQQGFSVSTGVQSYIKTTNDWITELRGLHDGLAAVNEVAVRLRMKTGFEALPSPVPIPLELPPPEPEPVPLTVRELLQELEQDDEHAGLVRLTRRLLSIVALPRPVSSPDDQPLGGVSDITNRGPFDRLLLSELAHDSDVPMTRVALNEAMYIRREVPPAFPPRERLILVDAGIRMWGLPRLYATAAALAFAVMQAEQATTRLYRPTSGGVAAVDLTVRDELIEHLASLELPVHPGKALPAFLAAASGAVVDFVIVTSEDVFGDPEFRQCLANQQFPNLYIATVTREGDFRLLQRSRQGERILRQAKLDLNQILSEPPRARPKLRDESIDPQLPAICRVKPFPLYLHHQLDWDNCGVIHQKNTVSGDRVVSLLSVTHDRRLTLWSNDGLGPFELTDRLPPGKLLWHALTSNHDTDELSWIFVVGIVEQAKLSLIAINTQGTEIVPLELPLQPVRGVSEHSGILYVVQAHELILLSTGTGQRMATIPLPPEMTWVRGRFFKNSEGHHALAYDGQKPVWHLIRKKHVAFDSIKAIFDCECLAAPVAVHTDNSVEIIGSDRQLKFQSQYAAHGSTSFLEAQIGSDDPRHFGLDVAKVAADGNRFVLMDRPETASIRHGWLVDLERMTAVQSWGSSSRILNSTELKYPDQKSLRNRFAMIGVYDDQLVLMTTKGKFVEFYTADNPERLTLKELSINRQAVECAADFRPTQHPKGVGYELKLATWPDGSRAYLDSRGLLHLQSSDTEIPEMSLVLYDTNVAGWCDRNSMWGDPSFTGPVDSHARTHPAIVKRIWLKIFCRRLK